MEYTRQCRSFHGAPRRDPSSCPTCAGHSLFYDLGTNPSRGVDDTRRTSGTAGERGRGSSSPSAEPVHANPRISPNSLHLAVKLGLGGYAERILLKEPAFASIRGLLKIAWKRDRCHFIARPVLPSLLYARTILTARQYVKPVGIVPRTVNDHVSRGSDEVCHLVAAASAQCRTCNLIISVNCCSIAVKPRTPAKASSSALIQPPFATLRGFRNRSKCNFIASSPHARPYRLSCAPAAPERPVYTSYGMETVPRTVCDHVSRG